MATALETSYTRDKGRGRRKRSVAEVIVDGTHGQQDLDVAASSNSTAAVAPIPPKRKFFSSRDQNDSKIVQFNASTFFHFGQGKAKQNRLQKKNLVQKVVTRPLKVQATVGPVMPSASRNLKMKSKETTIASGKASASLPRDNENQPLATSVESTAKSEGDTRKEKYRKSDSRESKSDVIPVVLIPAKKKFFSSRLQERNDRRSSKIEIQEIRNSDETSLVREDIVSSHKSVSETSEVGNEAHYEEPYTLHSIDRRSRASRSKIIPVVLKRDTREVTSETIPVVLNPQKKKKFFSSRLQKANDKKSAKIVEDIQSYSEEASPVCETIVAESRASDTEPNEDCTEMEFEEPHTLPLIDPIAEMEHVTMSNGKAEPPFKAKPQIEVITPAIDIVRPPIEPVQPAIDVVPPVLRAPAAVPKPTKKFFSSRAPKSNDNKIAQFNAKAFFSFDETIISSSQASGSQSSEGGSSQPVATLSDPNPESEYVTMHRIRKAYQCHDLGETEAFDGDIKFYLDGLEDSNTTAMRCLSILGLATQCMRTEFRMHLRAHDDMPRILGALKDAPANVNLAFCTSALMFIYNQDKLTMDIDPDHLKLMLNLLEMQDEEGTAIEKKHLEKVKDLVEQMKQRGFGKFLDPKNLTAGMLTLEALLGLTTKRAGDWFKEELRRLQGIDFLMNTVNSIIDLDENLVIESALNKVDRTLRVLEAATFMNEENQLYVINYEKGHLISSCIKLLRSNKDNIVIFTDSKVYLSSLLSVLRVFTNITSESMIGSELMGTRFAEIFELFIEILFEVPSFIAPDSRFDLTILILCLCINLVEFCKPLRSKLISWTGKLKRLVEMLLDRVEQAKQTEQQADELFDSVEKNKNEVVNIDTLLNQVVAKSGKHMEHSIVAACVSLLLGCTIQENASWKEQIADLLPDKSFVELIDVLRKLHEFANLADIMTPSGVKRVEKILQVFKDTSSSQNPKNGSISNQKSEGVVDDDPSLLSVSASFFQNDSDDEDDEFNQTADSMF